MTSPGLARYTSQMAPHEALAFRQLVQHLHYPVEKALEAIDYTELLPKDHHSRTADGVPAELRAEVGGATTEGARDFSSISARPDEIPTPAGTPGDLPVGLGAQAPLAPPFWLAELRRARSAHG